MKQTMWTIVCIATTAFHGTVADSGTDDATKPQSIVDEQMKDNVVSVETHKLALLQTEFKALKESFAEMKESTAKEMMAMKESAAMEMKAMKESAAALREIIATKTAFIDHRLKQLESRPIQASVATPGTVAPPEGRRLSAPMGLSAPMDESTAGISFTPKNGFSSGVSAPSIYATTDGDLYIYTQTTGQRSFSWALMYVGARLYSTHNTKQWFTVGQGATVELGLVEHSSGANVDTSNNRFKPVGMEAAGYYSCTGSMGSITPWGEVLTYLTVAKNGQSIGSNGMQSAFGSNARTLSVTALTHLNGAGDYVELTYYTRGGKEGAPTTSFEVNLQSQLTFLSCHRIGV